MTTDVTIDATAGALLIGAGDLGTEIGLRLHARGESVTAVRRRPELVPAELRAVGGDIRDGLPDLPALSSTGPRHLVICLTAGSREESAYRATFLDGLSRVLHDVAARGWAPERAVFVSSTGVCAPTGHVDEDAPPAPSSPTSQILLEAEQRFRAELPDATTGIVVRPSGLYGPGREWFIDQVRRRTIRDPRRTTHRIHRDDVAAAIVHLLTEVPQPHDLYLLTDDAPVPADEVAAFIAERLDVPWQRTPNPGDHGDGFTPERLISNARLRATGFTLTYPSYREGYSAVLAGVGTRHP